MILSIQPSILEMGSLAIPSIPGFPLNIIRESETISINCKPVDFFKHHASRRRGSQKLGSKLNYLRQSRGLLGEPLKGADTTVSRLKAAGFYSFLLAGGRLG